MYEEAPGFRRGPRVMTRAQVRRDRVVLSVVDFPSQPNVRDNHSCQVLCPKHLSVIPTRPSLARGGPAIPRGVHTRPLFC